MTALSILDHDTETEVILPPELSLKSASTVWSALARLEEESRALHFNASGVRKMDSAGIALLIHYRQVCNAASRPFRVTGLEERYDRLFHLFDSAELKQTWEDERIAWHLDEIGRRTMSVWEKIAIFISYTGELTAALLRTAVSPGTLRFRDFLSAAEKAGLFALPITVLIGFLLGLILAFESAIPMRRFGAEIFVANLIGLGIMRELGPLMTSVILAGRSGSSFAAEIGTMRINEEIDALSTMGYDPISFLVVPRVLAVLLISPMLVLFFNLAALAGGAVVMLSMGFPLVTYVQQVQASTGVWDLAGGLMKAMAFGFAIAAIGCYRGLETKTGASAVGASTTSAVVSGIILIAVLDGIFSVVFYFMGW